MKKTKRPRTREPALREPIPASAGVKHSSAEAPTSPFPVGPASCDALHECLRRGSEGVSGEYPLPGCSCPSPGIEAGWFHDLLLLMLDLWVDVSPHLHGQPW